MRAIANGGLDDPGLRDAERLRKPHRRRELSDAIPRYVAIHEAGHAVASWVLQRELGRDWCQFHRIVVRSPLEIAAGPFIDRRGREVDCSGLLEGSPRYQSVFTLGGREIYAPEFYADAAAAHPGLLDDMRAAAEADAVEFIAGPAAEARYRRWSFLSCILFGGDNDWFQASATGRDWTRTAEEFAAFLDRAEKRARALVRDRRVWAAVNALADALMVRRIMEAEEACELIGAAYELDREAAQTGKRD